VSDKSNNRSSFRGAAQRTQGTPSGTSALRFLRVARLLIPMVLLALSGTASAQIEPASPGSVEYTLTSNNQTWIETSDPITIGTYVEDLLTDRSSQPDGRGLIGIVTDTGFDADYGVDAATVDFGRGYSAGIVFPELTAVQIVPEPSTLFLLPGVLLWRAAVRRRRQRLAAA
jgi:hypothetical protein